MTTSTSQGAQRRERLLERARVRPGCHRVHDQPEVRGASASLERSAGASRGTPRTPSRWSALAAAARCSWASSSSDLLEARVERAAQEPLRVRERERWAGPRASAASAATSSSQRVSRARRARTARASAPRAPARGGRSRTSRTRAGSRPAARGTRTRPSRARARCSRTPYDECVVGEHRAGRRRARARRRRRRPRRCTAASTGFGASVIARMIGAYSSRMVAATSSSPPSSRRSWPAQKVPPAPVSTMQRTAASRPRPAARAQARPRRPRHRVHRPGRSSARVATAPARSTRTAALSWRAHRPFQLGGRFSRNACMPSLASSRRERQVERAALAVGARLERRLVGVGAPRASRAGSRRTGGWRCPRRARAPRRAAPRARRPASRARARAPRRADRKRPASTISIASDLPTARGVSCVPPAPGMMPRFDLGLAEACVVGRDHDVAGHRRARSRRRGRTLRRRRSAASRSGAPAASGRSSRRSSELVARRRPPSRRRRRRRRTRAARRPAARRSAPRRRSRRRRARRRARP